MDEWHLKDIAWNIVYTDPEAIHVLQHDLQQDPEIFGQAITRGLKIIPSNLADHQDLMLIFCTQVPDGIKQVSERLQQNKIFILEVVKAKPRALEFLDPKFQDDEEIVLAAVTTKGASLHYASARLQESKDMIVAAIKGHDDPGNQPIKIPKSLASDRDLIKLLATHSDNALSQASDDLRQDKDFISEILAINPKTKL